jgi:hypothetical protein
MRNRDPSEVVGTAFLRLFITQLFDPRAVSGTQGSGRTSFGNPARACLTC